MYDYDSWKVASGAVSSICLESIAVVIKYPNDLARPALVLLETPLSPAQAWQHWHPLYALHEVLPGGVEQISMTALGRRAA